MWLRSVLRATTAYIFSTSEPPTMVRTPSLLDLLTSKCASRHNGVHCFNISTSKRGRRPPVFNTFDFKMCFAPQRRALFRHLDFHKWSGPGVYCAFWLGNVLRAWVWRTLVRHLNFQKWSETASFLHFWLGNVVVVVVVVIVVVVVVVVAVVVVVVLVVVVVVV